MRPILTLTAFAAIACELNLGLPDVITESSPTTSTATDDASATTRVDESTTTDEPATTSTDETTTTTDSPSDPSGDSTSTNDDATASTTTDDTDDTTAGCSGTEPLSAICETPCDCESAACFSFGDDSLLWSVCGECDEDADCPGGGCNAASWLSLYASSCHDGAPGGTCESDAACQPGLRCGVMIEIPDLVTHQTCNACLSDADCAGDTLCSPTYDIAHAGGYRSCVAPGSLPLGASCDPQSNGAAACASGICSAVDAFGELGGPGGFEVGVCSECVLNDCTYPEVCSGPSLDTRTLELVPATCISKV